ncbi:MAG: class I SAM-dependent methyltransferase [Magnetococcales bacterium]|nr:class I SAM-dependent methyltransferase [Magnetococcales bacterium]
MKFYEETILPWVINRVMAKKEIALERKKMVPLASGRVLEIGMGSGFNIPFYSSDVEWLFGLEPSAQLKQYASEKAEVAPFPVEFVGLTGEEVPLDDNSIDTVVSTWTMCTIPDMSKALAEIDRILKTDGKLIFVEHGLSPDRTIRIIQNSLNPAWKRIGGGCHLNRPIDEMIREAGFHIQRKENGYMDGKNPLSFLYRGEARR